MLHFGEFHEIVVFKAAWKMRIAYQATTLYKNVIKRHYLQDPFCAMCKSIDRLLGQAEEKKATT